MTGVHDFMLQPEKVPTLRKSDAHVGCTVQVAGTREESLFGLREAQVLPLVHLILYVWHCWSSFCATSMRASVTGCSLSGCSQCSATEPREDSARARQRISSGLTNRCGASFGRRDMASEQWGSLAGLVHTLHRSSDKRRRQRATRLLETSMLSSQHKLEWSVLITNSFPSR